MFISKHHEALHVYNYYFRNKIENETTKKRLASFMRTSQKSPRLKIAGELSVWLYTRHLVGPHQLIVFPKTDLPLGGASPQLAAYPKSGSWG